MINEDLQKSMLKEHKHTDFVFKKHDEEKFVLVKTQQTKKKNEVLVMISDISRIKDLEATETKLMNIFFSTMAHQLKTPLNSIMAMAQKLT